MIAYAVLAAVAWWTLSGDIRLAVLVLLGGLMVKTWIGHWKQQQR